MDAKIFVCMLHVVVLVQSIVIHDIGYTKYEESDAKLILDRHNYYRATTNPQASNMKNMRWNSNLAGMAQRWADQCKIQKGGFSGEDNTSGFGAVSQLVQMNQGSPFGFWDYRDPEMAINRWHSSRSYYNYEQGRCSYDRHGPADCLPYTQIVWADTEFVGCGWNLCQGDKHFIVCNYGPAGNRAGMAPYKAGGRCSKCPPEANACFTFSWNLCTQWETWDEWFHHSS